MDVTPEILKEIYYLTKDTPLPEDESVWVGLTIEETKFFIMVFRMN